MPTIRKLKKKRRQSYRAQQRHELYKLDAWRELSKFIRMTHPVCAICEHDGKVTPSEHVHHISSPFRVGLTNAQKLELLLCPTNLIALCSTCHSLIHAHKLQIPPDLLGDIISGDYYENWRENLEKNLPDGAD